MESQLRTGLPGVANFRASAWNRAPIDRMANLNIEPGDSSFEDIISSIEKGVYMESNRSWSIDDYRNKFQFGCEYGKLIEDGKLTAPIKGATLAGNGPEVLKYASMVGNDSQLDPGIGICGKDGQSVPVCVGQPTLKVDKLTVGGTQAG